MIIKWTDRDVRVGRGEIAINDMLDRQPVGIADPCCDFAECGSRSLLGLFAAGINVLAKIRRDSKCS